MGGKLPSADDRRVQRTRRALREALVALLLERGWDGFSVQDVCDRADVGRSTFYTHFADKEELVAGSFDDLGRFLRAHREPPGPGADRVLPFARGLIEHALEQRRLFLALVGKKSGHIVLRQFRELVRGLVAEDVAALLPGGPRREAAVAFLAGAFLEFLTWALESKAPPEAAALDAHFHRLAAPALAAA
jgi:AcrR family transcriptional regulator